MRINFETFDFKKSTTADELSSSNSTLAGCGDASTFKGRVEAGFPGTRNEGDFGPLAIESTSQMGRSEPRAR